MCVAGLERHVSRHEKDAFLKTELVDQISHDTDNMQPEFGGLTQTESLHCARAIFFAVINARDVMDGANNDKTASDSPPRQPTHTMRDAVAHMDCQVPQHQLSVAL